MKYVFPFNSSATNVIFLISITLSYLCFPVMAFVVTHAVCGFFASITTYWQQFSSATAFLVVSIYSLFGLLHLYFTFIMRSRKNRK